MTFPFSRRRRERRAAIAGDFPDTGETITEILGRARPPAYDARTIPFEGASGTGQPDPPGAAIRHQDEQIAAIRAAGYRAWDTRRAPRQAPATGTGPLALARARGPQPDTFPALPPAAPQPPPWAGRDCAIPVLTRDGHGILCSHCRWRRHADPEALTFRELRRSAWLAGWRKDLFGNWNCTRCKMNPGFWTPQPPAHWDPAAEHGRAPGDWPARHWLQRRRPATEDHADASAAWVARDPAAEFWFAVEAEHEVLRRTADGASHGRHHRAVTS